MWLHDVLIGCCHPLHSVDFGLSGFRGESLIHYFVWEYSFGRGTVFPWGCKPNSLSKNIIWSWAWIRALTKMAKYGLNDQNCIPTKPTPEPKAQKRNRITTWASLAKINDCRGSSTECLHNVLISFCYALTVGLSE